MRNILLNLSACLMAMLLCSPGSNAQEKVAPPDLTMGVKVDRKLTYNLGATGLRGWIYTKAANFFESQQGRTTTASRQILVTHVGPKTPADGVINVDDVIVGINGKPFADDARKMLALAIQEAEKPVNQGVLKLSIWRAGKTQDVQLNLRPIGEYSPTAPFDCPKSKLIFDEACRVLEQESLKDDLWGAVNGLALLSTGKAEYLPRLQEFARKLGPKTLKLELRPGMVIWEWGYRNLFLCEYYLLTGDQEVLHAIREYTITLAKGQSMYGTFGHGIANVTTEGELHGSIPPYGPVNAAGLIGNLAIVMGKKCGVEHPEINPAIERASKFFGYYVDKGAIPYGEHMPWPNHDNNGKNAMTAVMYAVQNDRINEARYFAKMVTASYQNREYGHTGQGFSYLWGALGANAGGPLAASAFMKQASWHLDLVRRTDGSFTYDGGEQYGPGRTEDNTYFGKSSYFGLSPTATYVLTYSLPLKKLLITGRDANQKNWLAPKDVTEAIQSGRFDLVRSTLKVDELLTALGDWSPVARGWAAEEIAKRPEKMQLVPTLIKLAEGPDAHKRQGAAEALGYIKSADALPVLVRLLVHEDRWLRVKAANALRNMGDTAKTVVPEMLKAVVSTAEPLKPIVWADPIQLTHGELAAALFQGLLRSSIKGIDPDLLYPAIRAIAKNADGMARATLTNTIANQLTLDDVRALAPDILEAIDIPCPADTMFANEIRMAGLRALSKYHFKEGIRVSLKFAKTQSAHGSESRTGEIMKELLRYGKAAKEVIPELKQLIVYYQAEKDFPDWAKKRKIASVEEAIKTLEMMTAEPELRTITPVKTSTGPKKPIKVFILAGQSNMEGQSVVDLTGKDYNNGKGTLAMMLKDPAKAKLIKHLTNEQGEWITRNDVWVRYQREKQPLLKGPLGIGYSVYGDKHHFGPELQFGHVVGDQLDEQVLLIKTAWGGKSLYKDFRPPSSGGAVGPYYKLMIADIRTALEKLNTEFAVDPKQGYELSGFVWYHGWNDGVDPKNAIPEYEQNLVNLINDVRKEFNTPKLPVVIGEITGAWVKAPKEWETLRQAQAKAANRPEYKGNVIFVETHDFVRKPEESPNPTHGHHEFGNAETYFLVGDALGKGMMQLLKPVTVEKNNPPKKSAPKAKDAPALPTSRTDVKIEGWTIRVDDRLVKGPDTELGKKALKFLENKLSELKVVVPEDKVKQMQTVVIVLDLTHGNLGPMQYHPSAGWLKDNGYSPELAKCVHLPRAADVATKRNINEQPWVILHELTHAYHDQFLGFEEPRIKEAYEKYKKCGHGDKALLYNGSRVKHYGLTNHKEFFAEMTEAYFGVNDFFPFNRAELKDSEPEIYEMLQLIWSNPKK